MNQNNGKYWINFTKIEYNFSKTEDYFQENGRPFAKIRVHIEMSFEQMPLELISK